MTGTLGILNVGAGDTKISFDKSNPAERARAGRIVADMLRRGFAIFIEVGVRDGKPLYQRAEAFDPETSEYLIAGDPPADPGPDSDDRAAPAPIPEVPDEKEATPPARAPRGGKAKGRAPRRRVAAEKTRGVAVAPSAGG